MVTVYINLEIPYQTDFYLWLLSIIYSYANGISLFSVDQPVGAL